MSAKDRAQSIYGWLGEVAKNHPLVVGAINLGITLAITFGGFWYTNSVVQKLNVHTSAYNEFSGAVLEFNTLFTKLTTKVNDEAQAGNYAEPAIADTRQEILLNLVRQETALETIESWSSNPPVDLALSSYRDSLVELHTVMEEVRSFDDMQKAYMSVAQLLTQQETVVTLLSQDIGAMN